MCIHCVRVCKIGSWYSFIQVVIRSNSYISIRIFEDAMSIYFLTLFPDTLIRRAICMQQYTFAMHSVTDPLTFVYISFGISLDSETLPQIHVPLSFVGITVRILHNTLALSLTSNPLTIVNTTITIKHLSISMRDVLTPFSLVNISTRISYGSNSRKTIITPFSFVVCSISEE
jgi:hypothetical protein